MIDQIDQPDHWNHRVMKVIFEDSEPYFGIHEVYYKDGNPFLHTENPTSIVEESVEDLESTIDRIKKCLEKPILEYKDGKYIEIMPQAHR